MNSRLTDKDIKKRIIEELQWDNRIDSSRISVIVDGGEVVLEGKVSRYRAKMSAQEDAWMIDGVTSVENNLEVEPVKQEAVLSDDEIHDRIKLIFFADPDLVSSRLNIKVKDGVVTLIGKVDSIWKKHYAEVRASTVSGVRDVSNQIAVVLTDKKEDKEIADKIVCALDRRNIVDGDNVDVRVEDAKVKLDGAVESRAAWESVYDVVRFTDGVSEIENNLTVEVD
jgi:osmotically-inducible protein OsmY